MKLVSYHLPKKVIMFSIHTKFWLENLKGRDHSEDPGIDGRIISEWLLGKQVGKM
jgi:hypothetical protein